MADIKLMKELALHSVKGTAPANYSEGSVDQALLDGFKEMASSIATFMKNRYDIYEIITTAADEIVPNKVIDAVGIFAEVQTVPQGSKALFKKKNLGKARARQFLTYAALSGVYETFRLDNSTFEIPVKAVGMATELDFERILDGAENLADLMDIMVTAQVDSVYQEVQTALRAALNAKGRPAANKVSVSGFDAKAMMDLISTVRAYGSAAVIFAPPEFVAAMGADAIVPVGASFQGVYHPQDIDAIHNQGYINIFRGTPIVQIPQSFIDEKNEKTWIDPQLAYVLPTGQERVVKVALEGNTQMWDRTNEDQSMEFRFYRKIGAAILCHYNWGVYQNKDITQTYEAPYSNI